MATNLEFIKEVVLDASGGSDTKIVLQNIFSERYDNYFITMTKIGSNIDYYVWSRLIDASDNEITGSEYAYASEQLKSYGAEYEGKSTGTTNWNYMSYVGSGDEDSGGMSLYIHNPYDANSYTFATGEGVGYYGTSGSLGYKFSGVHKVEERITGITFNGASDYSEFIVKVYGIK